MNNKTPTALHHAGPTNWHHLIAPTKTHPLTEATAQAAALSMDTTASLRPGIAATFALAELAATTIILSNAIATSIPETDAREIFQDARATARILNDINGCAHKFQPTFKTYRVFRQAIETNDPQVLALLLIDTIRIAYHLTVAQ